MSRVDWSVVHAGLERARAGLQQALSTGPTERLEILRARARALARQPAETGPEEDALELVTFTVAGESYAIESAYVEHVQPLKALVPLPGTPPFVRGIVSLRGRIVAVVDIRKFFQLPDKGLSDLNRLVILGGPAMTFAILADAIQGVRRLRPSELQAALPAPEGPGASYVRGISSDRLVVLAAQRLLSDADLMVDQNMNMNLPGERGHAVVS